MMSKRLIRMEMNRVEGDLEIQLEVEDHTVTDAWCIGTMYRGYEQILLGRDPNDVLVITPRICGICSTSQLYAATATLEMAYQAPVAPNGIRIRNLCLMAESVMSDASQTFLMFAPDFCNQIYSTHHSMTRSCSSLNRRSKAGIARQTVHYSKHILGIIIAFGGQWPHATYMLPGGITSPWYTPGLGAVPGHH